MRRGERHFFIGGDLKRNSSNFTTILFFTVLITISLLSVYFLNGYSFDDAYIHLMYSKNFRNGNGWTFQKYEIADGATSLVFVILLAVLNVTETNQMLLLSAFFLGLSCFIVYLTFKRQNKPFLGFFVSIVLILMPNVLQSYCMETTLFIFVGLTCIFLFEENKMVYSGILAALIFFIRPDGILIFGIITITNFFRLISYLCYSDQEQGYSTRYLKSRLLLILKTDDFKENTEKIKDDPYFKFLISFIPFFSILTFVSILIRGHFFPLTLGAKRAQVESGYWPSFLEVFLGINFITPIEIFLLLLGIISTLINFKKFRYWTFWLIFYIFSYEILSIGAYHWYFSLPLFLILPLQAIGCYNLGIIIFYNKDLLFKHSKTIKGDLRIILLFPTKIPLKRFSFVYLIIVLFLITKVQLFATYDYQWYSQGVENVLVMRYKDFAYWFNDNFDENNLKIGIAEVGTLRYFLNDNFQVIDLLGLITPGVASHIRTRDFSHAVIEYKPNILLLKDGEPIIAGSIRGEPWFNSVYEKLNNHPHSEIFSVYRLTNDSAIPKLMYSFIYNFNKAEITSSVSRSKPIVIIEESYPITTIVSLPVNDPGEKPTIISYRNIEVDSYAKISFLVGIMSEAWKQEFFSGMKFSLEISTSESSSIFHYFLSPRYNSSSKKFVSLPLNNTNNMRMTFSFTSEAGENRAYDWGFIGFPRLTYES